MKKFSIEIKWGIIFALSTVIWMYFEKMMGWHGENIGSHGTFTNLFAIPAIIIYVLAIREKREKYYNGQMTWLQGFISGAVIGLIVAILSPLTQYITHQYISPEYFPNIIEYSVANDKMTREAAEKYFNLRSYIIQSVTGAVVMGVITAAVVSLFLKRKGKISEEQIKT